MRLRWKTKYIRPQHGDSGKISKVTVLPQGELVESDLREKYFTLSVMAILLGFGIYRSILYYDFQAMPAPDFGSFMRAGRQFWFFKLEYFWRAPVLGFLVYPLSLLVRGDHPALTVAMLLNSVLHPLNLILLYLVGKEVIGKSASCFALLAFLNPWLMKVGTRPLVETLFLFLSLLTLYLIFKRSYWCYLFASIAAISRYEGGCALIMACFVMDMLCRKTVKDEWYAFCCSVAASIPFGLWMLLCIIYEPNQPTGYLQFFSVEMLTDIGHMRSELNLLWSVTFRPFLQTGPGPGGNSLPMVVNIGMIMAGITFIFGSLWDLLKRRWKVLPLLLFFVPYMLVHFAYSFSEPRFYTLVHWTFLLICWYGIQNIWALISKSNRLSLCVVRGAQVAVLILNVAWLSKLIGFLPAISATSPVSKPLPFVATGAVTLIFVTNAFVYNARHLWVNLVIVMVMTLAIFSNQFILSHVLNIGSDYAEFRQLIDWYGENARPGEKMHSFMAGIIRWRAPMYADHIIKIVADSPEDFVNRCYAEHITYVTWDSSTATDPNSPWYKQDKRGNISFLYEPRDISPYEYITTITVKRRDINIFRLRYPPPALGGKSI
jgi:hypothetical protein